MTRSVPFEDLKEADLHVDRVYEGGTAGNVADDPLQRLLPVGNQGGFRYKGSPQKDDVRLVVLYTSGDEREWPDNIDPYTGILTYFGDNRRPGHDLHDTRRHGNELLRRIFERAHGDADSRSLVPPILVFSKGEKGRDVVFRGLAVPGANSVAPGDDLVAVWRAKEGQRFQNYRAVFTILDEAEVPRKWIDQSLAGSPTGPVAPGAWLRWQESGVYDPLISERIDIRTRAEQLPVNVAGEGVVAAIHRHFSGNPYAFEACAVEIWRRLAPATGEVNLTRPWRDGGRDAVGSYLLGPASDRLPVEFSLEAKCYALNHGVGVRDMSRLISRLRYRQFGVFVTTSYFHQQTYEEVRLDEHPVVLICARDIVEILAATGLATASEVMSWLATEFPGP